MSKHANTLTVLILLGLVFGVLIGQFGLYDPDLTREVLGQQTAGWKLAGEFVFIRPLKLLIIPLIFTSVLTGIVSIGDPKKLGFLGGATLIYYVSTMVLAVGTGVLMASMLVPGSAVPPDLLSEGMRSGATIAAERAPSGAAGQGLSQAWLEILRQVIPDNFFGAVTAGRALSIITATMLLGFGLVAVGERGKAFVEVVESLHEALMFLVRVLLWLMPIGVMCLMAWAVGNMGLKTLFSALSRYMGVVMLGLGVHMFVTLPVVLWVFGRANPFRFMWNMRPALLTAFSTASSMATLPVTIETASEQAGCSKRATGLVLPLGATVNMDGTALYQGIAVIFMFQAYGYDLSLAQYMVIVLTATLSAIGAAGVPGGSLATILIIITAVNTTLASSGLEPLPLSAIGLILGVDRLLDMCRTMVNVWGDSVGARLVSRLAPDDDEEKEEAYG